MTNRSGANTERDNKEEISGTLSLVFKRELVLQLTSSKWQTKESALRKIIDRMVEYLPSPHFTQTFNYLLQLCFDEKSIQISVLCIKLISAILKVKPDFQFEFLT